MRSLTTSVGLAAVFLAALCIFIPFASTQAATGQVQVTVRDEARQPVAGATVEVSCNGSTYATLGTTSATGTVWGNPTVGTTCVNGSGLLFRTSSSTFATQLYPVIAFTLLPYYTSVDPSDASSAITGSTNIFKFGVDTQGTYSLGVWNAGGDASVLPFPTDAPDYATTSSQLAFNWGVDTSPYPGINAQDWFVQATKTVTLVSGWYEFDIASDDGGLVKLDGTTILDKNFLQSLPGRPYIKRLYVSGGTHTIDVRYYEHTGYTGLYFRFYPIDDPAAPVVDIGAPVSSPLNNRIAPSLGVHTDTAGTLTFGGGCTSTDPIAIGVGTSTVSMTTLSNGTYNSCTLTVTDPDTDYATTVVIPSFTVIAPPLVHVSDCDELYNLRSTSTYYAVDVILDTDIDCSEYPFAPLSWSGGAFMGVFDGNHYTISNLEMSTFSLYVGLFDRLNGATIKDLTFTASDVRGRRFIGTLAGTADNPTLTNVHVNGSTSQFLLFPSSSIGGLFGQVTFDNGTTTEWSNVTFNGSMTSGFGPGGGLSGNATVYASSTFILDNTHVSGGDITSSFAFPDSQTGGLFGKVDTSGTSTVQISNSSVSSPATADGVTGVGGLIGGVSLDSSGRTIFSITHSSSSGNISGLDKIGGLIGSIEITDGGAPLSLTLTNNQRSGAVAGTGDYAGGLIGYLSFPITSAVAATMTLDSNTIGGAISGTSYVGGILGGSAGSGNGVHLGNASATGGLTISNSIVNSTVAGNDAGGLVGFLSCKSDNPSQYKACLIQQNYTTGNVTGAQRVGGVAGYLDGDIDLENVYATGDVTGASDVGGLIGKLISTYSYATVRHGYYAGTIHTSGGSPVRVGGLIGTASSADANTSIENLFADVSVDDGSGVGQVGWMMGTLEGTTPTGLAYHSGTGSASSCVYSNPTASFCSAQPASSYFYEQDNAPQSQWDFGSVWAAHADTYPTLRMAAVTTDVTSPNISDLFEAPSSDSAQLSWYTDESASTNIFYGLTTSYGNTTGISDRTPRVRNHRVTISGLLPCRTYQWQAVSIDRYGNTATSTNVSFTTQGCGSGALTGNGSGGGGGGGWSAPIITRFVETLAPSASTTRPQPPVSTTSSIALSQPVVSTSGTGSNTTSQSSDPRQCFRFTFTKDLRQGMNTPDVKQLQIFLNAHNAPIMNGTSSLAGAETTYFGPATRKALAQFQRSNTLPATGVFASTTRSLIQSQMERIVCPPALPRFPRTLRSGSSGTDVRTLQRVLRIIETGFFGPLTKKALQAFQQGRTLPMSGIVDEVTRTVLNNLP